MTVTRTAASLNVVAVVVTIMFVAGVLRSITRGPTPWLLWPPRTLIGLAVVAGACCLGRSALTGNLVNAATGVGWLIVAAALGYTRRWLRRHLRPVVDVPLPTPPSEENPNP